MAIVFELATAALVIVAAAGYLVAGAVGAQIAVATLMVLACTLIIGARLSKYPCEHQRAEAKKETVGLARARPTEHPDRNERAATNQHTIVWERARVEEATLRYQRITAIEEYRTRQTRRE